VLNEGSWPAVVAVSVPPCTPASNRLLSDSLLKSQSGQDYTPERATVSIVPGAQHRISNESTEAVRFLVIFQPTTAGDRDNL
jgi:hypothetical protein